MRSRLLALTALAALAPALSDAAGPPTLVRRDGHGDPLPEGALLRLGTVRLRHDQQVQCVAFSPDGKALLTGGYSRELVYWDTATGKELKRVTVSPHGISSIQFSADGKVLALGCNDGSVRILDGKTGKEVKSLTDPMRNYNNTFVVLAPDGKSLLATAQYGRDVLLWDVASASVRQRYTFLNNNYTQALNAAFTPDGKRFIMPYNDNKLHVFETATGAETRVLESTGPSGDQNYMRMHGLAVSPDGKAVAVGDSSRNLLLVDLAADKVIRRFEQPGGHYYSNRALAFTPNGRFLVDLQGPHLLVWGVGSGRALRSFPAPNNYMPNLAVARNGKLAATASGNVISLYDLSAGKQLHAGAGHGSSIARLAFTPDGRRLVSGAGSSFRVWDARAGRQLHSLSWGSAGGLVHFALSRDGKALRWVSYDRALHEWKFGQEQQPRRLTSPTQLNVYYSQMAVSQDGRWLAGINNNTNKLEVVDLVGGQPPRELTTLDQPWSNALAFSPDGKRLAVATADRTLRLYDVAAGKVLWSLVPEGDRRFYYSPRMEFSPDGRSLIRFDSETHCYEVASGGERFKLGRDGGFAGVMAWSPDGRLVARALGDSSLVVYDTHTGNALLRRNGRQGMVTALAFSPDGRRLASGGSNTTILVWEVPAPPAAKGPLDKAALWRDLEGNDPARAFKAIAALASVPGEAVPLLKERLRPRPPVSPGVIAKLIADLDSNQYEVRERAEEELAKLGVAAEEALAGAARSRSLEVRRRAEQLRARLRGIPPERLRVLRAIEVLERSGTPAARELLRELARQRWGPLLEGEARASLERMKGEG
jgi:WD40 repeat protein